MRFVSVAAVAAFALAGLSSGVAHAESAPGCGPVTQIGKTAYIGGDSRNAKASVKQFKGCGKNWAYVYVWDSFASQVGDFQITVAMRVSGLVKGQKTYPRNKQEGWSEGTDSLTQCTSALGALKDFVISDTWLTAETDQRC
ncbi:hypothetical protein [Lentzea flava]|uniref:Secreted protein n=1 Tax=Lentzea flava TaxID=103732 RepID=A0ABQ2U9N6_9PSEU|nr:hypothetical protein [Lentzea flava]MCP2196903.1 hypothetical protein [Lentzea flava]GGU14652.1 hypothetical protein GCM10010178_02630 [Lentzea flava]